MRTQKLRTQKLWYVAEALVVCLLLAAPASAASSGAADMAGGYGWQVLEKVLPLWQPPAGASGTVIVALRVGSNGEILYCEPRVTSGSQTVDLAACSAVAQAGSFAPPGGGVPVEVFLALPSSGTGSSQLGGSYGTARPAQLSSEQSRPVGNYADLVMNQVRPQLRVPPDFKGEAVVVVHMRVDEKGRVVAAEVVEATGSTRSVEDAVLQAINRAGTMPPPPSGNQRLVLSFTLRGL